MAPIGHSRYRTLLVCAAAALGVTALIVSAVIPETASIAMILPLGVLAGVRPELGLLGLAATVPWEAGWYAEIYTFRVRAYEVFLAGLFLHGVSREHRTTGLLDSITWSSALYVLAGLPSLLKSPAIGDSLTVSFFELIMVIILFTVRSVGFSGSQLWTTTLFYVVVVGNLIGLIAIGQIIGYGAGYSVEYFHPEVYGVFRPSATFAEPNPYGNFLAAVATSSLILTSELSFRPWRVILYCTALFQIALLLINLSRGPWFGLAVSFCGAAAWRMARSRNPWPVLARVLSVGLVVVAVVALASISSGKAYDALVTRFAETVSPWNEGTAQWRLDDTARAWAAWPAHPLFGSGVGTWGRVAYGQIGREARMQPRSIFVSWLVEKGLVGALTAVWMYSAIVSHVVRAYLKDPSAEVSAIMAACLGGSLAIFVTFLFSRADVSPHFWFMMSLAIAAADAQRSGSERADRA